MFLSVILYLEKFLWLTIEYTWLVFFMEWGDNHHNLPKPSICQPLNQKCSHTILYHKIHRHPEIEIEFNCSSDLDVKYQWLITNISSVRHKMLYTVSATTFCNEMYFF